MKFLKLIFPVMAMLPFLCYGKVFTEKLNVSYNPEWERCVMDIYSPQDPESAELLPVIVWFHGGGLTGGEKFLPEQLKTGEYIVVAPNYRLLPNVSIDQCIDDAATAVAWVMDSISGYGGDPDKIFVSGHSAGGYLTSMIGLDKSWLEKHGKDADKIKGLIPFSGQAITHFAQRQKLGISELTPTIDEFAPLFHIRKDAPPYIIITGDRELELYGRYEENAYLYRMLKLQGHPFIRIYELDGYDHGEMHNPAYHILKNSIKEILWNVP